MPHFIGQIARDKAVNAALARARVVDEDGDVIDLADLLVQDDGEDDFDDGYDLDDDIDPTELLSSALGAELIAEERDDV